MMLHSVEIIPAAVPVDEWTETFAPSAAPAGGSPNWSAMHLISKCAATAASLPEVGC